jgi:preprotein translocase subunit SecA
MAFEQFLASLPQFLQSTDESGDVVETREPARPEISNVPEPSLDSVFGNRAREAQPVQIGRNDPCPCGSGRKFKACCGKGTV